MFFPANPALTLDDFCPLFVPLQYNTRQSNPSLFLFSDPSIPLMLSPCRSVNSMDFTFGGKYRLEEELAIGGCGSLVFLFITKIR